MVTVELNDIHKRFGNQSVLSGLRLSIVAGQYVVVLGSSGCGKSTLLKIIAGLIRPDSGTVHIDGQDVTHRSPRKRDVSLLFQSDALYPHLAIEKSIAAGLPKSLSAKEREVRVGHAMGMVGIGDLVGRLPQSLSGGERRRAALAKAITRGASVRLLDEPLSAVDAHLTHQIVSDLKNWHRSAPGVTIHVTHNGQIASQLADQIAVMHEGKIIQVDTPDKVMRNPATPEAANALSSQPVSVIEFKCDEIPQSLSSGSKVSLRWDDLDRESLENRKRIGFRVSDCQLQDVTSNRSALENQSGLTLIVKLQGIRRADDQSIATLVCESDLIAEAVLYAVLPAERHQQAENDSRNVAREYVCHVPADRLIAFS